jgi:hypothetical protein
MISVREAKAIPRPDGIEWRNKYICVEGSFPMITLFTIHLSSWF